MQHQLIDREGGYRLTDTVRLAATRYANSLERRSALIPLTLNRQIGAIATAWAGVFLLASVPKLLFPATPLHSLADMLAIGLPYLLIAFAPIAGYGIAAGSFPGGVLTAQPGMRLAIYGKWRRLSVLEARKLPTYGPAGFMASMLVGLLLNVVLRSFEFLLAVPALGNHAPDWGQALFHLMAADVVVMSFFYMVCFVMALRNVPYFPRMLLFTWALDIATQMIIARQLGGMANLPTGVASSLNSLLHGNITKVMISAFVWLPYLILSDRVNITYRLRLRD